MREGKRKFDKEFKVESVKLITEGGHDSRQVSSDLGVNYDTLRRWVREYEAGSLEAFPGKGRLSPKDEETRILRRENECLKIELHFKKSIGHLLERTQVKYMFIRDHREEFPISLMCEVIGVSRGGYSSWPRRPESKREIENRKLKNRDTLNTC